MGYYTYYSFEFINASEAEENEIYTKIHLRRGFTEDEIPRILQSPNKGFDECLKWYDHEIDMKIITEGYPDIGIIISGEGEEYDDRWEMYCRGGHVEKVYAQTYYPPPSYDFNFDELTN